MGWCIIANPRPWIQGSGYYPSADPFGRVFDAGYHPERQRMAGYPIMGPYLACLEGVQADQDFCRVAFHLENYYGKKQCCHYCPVIAYTSRYPKAGEPNDPRDLYTNFNEDRNRGTPNCEFASFFDPFFLLGYVCIDQNVFLFSWQIKCLRIVDLATFIAINGQSPLCKILGFTPDRSLVQQYVFSDYCVRSLDAQIFLSKLY